MDGNEMIVFSPKTQSENATHETENPITRTEFPAFVEESSLRVVNLNEEGADPDFSSRVDGAVRRASSTASSEAPVRYAIILECNLRYLNSNVGFLRMFLLILSVISFILISSAADSHEEILERIRFKIFVLVLTLGITLAFLLLNVIGLIESFPQCIHYIDAVLHACLCVFHLASIAVLTLGLEKSTSLADHSSSSSLLSDWVSLYIALSMGLSFMCMLVCFVISMIQGCCINKKPDSEDIAMRTLTSEVPD